MYVFFAVLAEDAIRAALNDYKIKKDRSSSEEAATII
jgi:hypothetical protein